MTLDERKQALQLELAQLQALAQQLERQRDEVRVRSIQITGKMQLLDELLAEPPTAPQDPET